MCGSGRHLHRVRRRATLPGGASGVEGSGGDVESTTVVAMVERAADGQVAHLTMPHTSDSSGDLLLHLSHPALLTSNFLCFARLGAKCEYASDGRKCSARGSQFQGRYLRESPAFNFHLLLKIDARRS